jgi:hypothetical protein
MNLDICFCGNTEKCPKKNMCRRNIENYQLKDTSKLYRTFTIFEYDKNNECKYFWSF